MAANRAPILDCKSVNHKSSPNELELLRGPFFPTPGRKQIANGIRVSSKLTFLPTLRASSVYDDIIHLCSQNGRRPEGGSFPYSFILPFDLPGISFVRPEFAWLITEPLSVPDP